jgi:FolB domain-containing protein
LYPHLRSFDGNLRNQKPFRPFERYHRDLPTPDLTFIMAEASLGEKVRQAVWAARTASLEITDSIHVRNLEVTANAGVDVWGRKKEQRALITVSLSLAQPFDSAAEADALDKSTVHYGKLSKDIQSCIKNLASWVSTWDLAETISKSLVSTAGPTDLVSSEISIVYPKSSMLGDGAGFSLSWTQAGGTVATSNVLFLRNVRIPCLIGVNSNERTAKQPVVVNLWIECVETSRADDYVKLESVVVGVSSHCPMLSLKLTIPGNIRVVI